MHLEQRMRTYIEHILDHFCKGVVNVAMVILIVNLNCHWIAAKVLHNIVSTCILGIECLASCVPMLVLPPSV